MIIQSINKEHSKLQFVINVNHNYFKKKNGYVDKYLMNANISQASVM